MLPANKDYGDIAEIAFAYLLGLMGDKIEDITNEQCIDLLSGLISKNAVGNTPYAGGSAAIVGSKGSHTKLSNFSSDYVDINLLSSLINGQELKQLTKKEQNLNKTTKRAS